MRYAMRSLRILLLILLSFGASALRAQTAREEIRTDPGKADGIYRPYTYQASASTPAPAGYEPFYISHFGRHGSRWLLHDSEYTDLRAAFDAAAAAKALTPYGEQIRQRVERIYTNGINRAGDLAPLGAAQHRGIAGRMYTAYPEVFRDSARIDARSTVVVRCVLSMAAFTERLKELNPALQIDRTAGLRNTRIFNFFSQQANPEISEEYLGLSKTPAWKAAAASFRAERIDPARLMAQLFIKGYAPKDPQRLMQLLGNARASLHGLDAGVTLDDLFTPEELYALWECENYDFYQYRGPSPATQGYPRQLAKPFLEDILTRADKAISESGPAADLRFGHDGNLMTILFLMQFEGCTAQVAPDKIAEAWRSYDISPMAANIQLIFYRDKPSGEVLVKVLRNEREVRLPIASDTAPYYRWKELRAFYRKILDDIPNPKQ